MVSMDKARERKESTFRGADLKLFVRDVRDRMARKRPITVRSWSTIKDIKDIIQQTIHVPASTQRLYFGPLMTSGFELPNHRTLHDAGIYKSGETLLLDIKAGSSVSDMMSPYSNKNETKNDVTISSSVVDDAPKLLKQIVAQSRRAVALGLKPELVLDGSGGTYFLHDARKAKIAIFKPADEEPYAENNPRGYLPQAGANMYLREGVLPGEACIREVAAFMLDHKGFADVPMTTLVEARHPAFNTNGARLKVSEGGASIGSHSISRNSVSSPASAKKVGSFQEFVRAECTMDDISPSMISVDEVHKIAILDIRLMNADRNSANLLCRRRANNSFELVPIDHGFCLRSVADVSWMDWCWLDWPQMKQPVSEKTKDYILSLDIEQDAKLLHDKLNICREALDYFCASSSILKAGVKAGMTLYDIAVMCCRNDNLGESPSKLEALFSMAADLAGSAIENGRWHHAAASRALAEQLTPNAGSLLNSSPSPGMRIRKSMSAVNINLSSLEAQSQQDPMPGMIQSSASDSSSDTGEDQDDCEEWAANLIADVSLDKSFSLLTTKSRRSLSIETEGSDDSSSPKGFWHTRPGDLEEEAGNDDDSWGSWESLEGSDDADFDHMKIPSGGFERRMSYNPFDKVIEASVAVTALPEGKEDSVFITKPRTPTKVKFDTRTTPEPSELDARFKHSNSDVGESVTFMQRPEVSSVKRSQSFSGLSSISQKITFDEEKTSSKTSRPEQEDQYREYFLSFVDLVIVRETTALATIAKQVE